jgi:two-component system, OmpR family, phosphate regulon sensor histidine kinase PhoR
MLRDLFRKGAAAVTLAAAVIAASAVTAVILSYTAGDIGATAAAALIVAIFLVCAAAGYVAVRMLVRRYFQPISRILESLTRTGTPGHTGTPEPSSTHLRQLAREITRVTSGLEHQATLLRRERDELQTILERMVEGVIVLDGRLRIRTANRSAASMFGVQPAGLDGKTLLEALRTTELSDFADGVRRSKTPQESSLTLYRDAVRHLQVHGISYNLSEAAEGDADGVLLVLNDISAMKRLEQMRKDFVSNVSHELKTPVTSIKGFVETLIDGAVDDRDRAEHFLRIILKQTDRIQEIIEDLLSLARLEQNDSRIEARSCAIRDVLGVGIDSCLAAAREKQIVVQEEYSGGPDMVCNPSLVEQAIVNLVDNAVKYSAAGTTVRVRAEREPGSVVISVMDHGQGIPEKDLSRIFERFYRVDRARTREVGGTGLGLAIVKHIALAHGGEVEVESELGKGSTFTMRLPQ